MHYSLKSFLELPRFFIKTVSRKGSWCGNRLGETNGTIASRRYGGGLYGERAVSGPGTGTSMDGRSICPRAAGEPWVGIVANRSSGTGGNKILVGRLVSKLGKLGFATEIAWTPDERKLLVAESGSRPGCRCLVAVGGDGTVSALVNEQPRVPITVLPAGTENLAAQHFDLRRNTAALARNIAAGQVIRADLGNAAGRRFLLMTGFGFDGDVVTRHHRGRTTRSGKVKPTHRAAYVEPILRRACFTGFRTSTWPSRTPAARRSCAEPRSLSSICRVMLWACRSLPRPARTTGCSIWSSFEIPGRSRRSTTSGASSVVPTLIIRAFTIAGSGG